METSCRVGTRTSPLALRQAREVLDAITGLSGSFKAEVVGIDTYGDKDRSTPISHIEGTDFFTREIDTLLINGGIDLAVHSAKDLPVRLPPGLVIAALTGSIDVYDALVSKSGAALDGLPYGAKIGTSSLRRKAQLKSYRNDFELIDIRGNIEERLEVLDMKGLDAVVIAAAGLVRLGLADRITQRIPLDILRPHPLQGALAVVARGRDRELVRFISALDSRKKILL